MARSRAILRRGTKAVHPVSWCCGAPVDQTTIAAGTTNVAAICTSATFEKFANPTIVRIRGDIGVGIIKSSQISAQRTVVAIGIRIMDDQVITAGDLTTAAVLEGPWMWRRLVRLNTVLETFPLVNSSGSLVGHTDVAWHTDVAGFYREQVDIKVMRRVPKNFQLIIQLSNESGGTAVNFFQQMNALVKE